MNNFYAIVDQLHVMREAGLQDSESYRRLSDLAMTLTPPEILSEIMELAVKEGMLPPADGIDEQGQRVWKLENIGKAFGLSESEITESLREFEAHHGEMERIDPATINLLH